jgi:hypothetical protein
MHEKASRMNKIVHEKAGGIYEIMHEKAGRIYEIMHEKAGRLNLLKQGPALGIAHLLVVQDEFADLRRKL